MGVVENELRELSEAYNVPVPPHGVIQGTTSVYRWGPRDILIADELIKEGSEKQIRKVTAHEFFHYLQHKQGRNMNLKPLTELEAEAMALKWISGDKPKLPVVPHPLQDYNNIQSMKELTFRFVPGLSSCGFDATSLHHSENNGFLSIVRKIIWGD